MVIYAALFVTALVSSLAITPLVARTCVRVGLLDRPGARKVHATPVPRLGGVAIALSLALTLGIAVVLDAHPAGRPIPDPRSLLPIISGASLIFAIGLWDDVDAVGPWTKLLAQSVAVAVVIGGAPRIEQVTIFGTTHALGWLAVPATAVWVLVITNAFNLMDGLDGLAGGLIAIAAITCAAVLMTRGELASAMLLVALVGAVLGFLTYNFHPAKIFMGDSGSLLSGFLLAVTAISGHQKGATTLAVGVPLLIFALPLADTLVAIARRLLGFGAAPAAGGATVGRILARLVTGDRAHIHHRLLQSGLSQRTAVLILYALMIACSAVALLTMDPR